MKDPYARLREFKGWFPDVDPRDVDEDTFADLIGYDPSRIQGMLIKDFGYSDAYGSATGTQTGGGTISSTFAAGTLGGGNTISSSGTTVTSTGGTVFLTELAAGQSVIIGGQTRIVASVTNDSEFETTVAFSPALVAEASFTLQTKTLTATGGTLFLTELAIGSTIVISSQTLIVATITSNTVLSTTTMPSPAISAAASFTYVNPYPTGVTILAMKTIHVEALNTEYQIVVGKTAAHKLKVFSRGFYDGAMYGGWFDLTEFYTGVVISAVGASDITIVVSQEYATNHFKGFTLIIGGNNVITCTASTRVDATHQLLTIAENALAVTSERLDPDSDVSTGTWVAYGGSGSLFEKLDDGDEVVPVAPFGSDQDVILSSSTTPNQCKIGFTNIAGTPAVTGFTRLYFRATTVGAVTSDQSIGTLIIDLRESGVSVGATTREVPHKNSLPFVEGYVEVANSSITNHDNLEAWLTATSQPNTELRVAWLKITVDVTDTIATADIYRFPVMTQLASYYANVGAAPEVVLSRSQSKMTIAVVDTSGVVLPPAQVLYVTHPFFSTSRSIDSLYFESASLSKEFLVRGMEITRVTSVGGATHTMIIVPIVDGYQFGDPIFFDKSSAFKNYSVKVDWGLFNKRVTSLEFYVEWASLKNLATSDGQRTYFLTSIDLTGDDSLWEEDVFGRLFTLFQDLEPYTDSTTPAEVTLDGARGAAYTTGAVRYRYHKPMTRRQSSLVAVDESDEVIRFSFYDAGGVHNDDIFIDSATDIFGNATMSFLSAPGELLGLAERLGMLYCFKQTTVEVIDMNTFSTAVFPIDCVAKRGIKETAAGVVFVGQHGIYLFPQGGGKEILINSQFLDTYRAITLANKQAAIAEENRAHNSIIFNIGDTAYIWNYNTQQWWKREFNHTPDYFSNKIDGIFQFTDGTKIYTYPDRTTYLDDSMGVEFRVETQWMSHGQPQIQKLLRNLSVAGLSSTAGNYRIEIYTDRNNLIAWDSLEVTMYNSFVADQDTDNTYAIKTPNSYREIKLVITKRTGSQFSQYGQLDFRDFRLHGELGRTGKEG